MNRDALNPNHPVTQMMDDQWHKIAGIIMHKLGAEKVVITADDIQAFTASGKNNIAIRYREDAAVVWLVDGEEAQRLANEAGGLRN